MFETAEVRWFWPEQNLSLVRSWFFAGSQRVAQEKRTDRYLVFPKCSSTGVKLREDRFEIKVRKDAVKPCFFPKSVEGQLEFWSKWSHDYFWPPAQLKNIHRSDAWQIISKHRLLRRFSIEGEEIASEVHELESGCQVELTQATTNAETSPWLTLGLEAFGTDVDLEEILTKVAADFFLQHGPPPGVKLTSDNSFGYPAWLARLGKAS